MIQHVYHTSNTHTWYKISRTCQVSHTQGCLLFGRSAPVLLGVTQDDIHTALVVRLTCTYIRNSFCLRTLFVVRVQVLQVVLTCSYFIGISASNHDHIYLRGVSKALRDSNVVAASHVPGRRSLCAVRMPLPLVSYLAANQQNLIHKQRHLSTYCPGVIHFSGGNSGWC